jgi:hypothetical protein
LLKDPQQHLAAGFRAARLYEAQMAGRDPGIEREFELSYPPALAPLAQERPDFGLGLSRRQCGRP